MKRLAAKSRSNKKAVISSIILVLSLLSCFFMFGCATPQASVNPDLSIDEYKDVKIVYIFAPDSEGDDPRNVYPQVVERLQGLGFQVHEITKDKPMVGEQGTGFLIDRSGYVLTCAHIFNGEKKASLWIKGERFDANVVEVDKDKDLALLKIAEGQGSDFQQLSIAKDATYKMGQDVYTIGFPLSDILGNSPRLNKGLISSTVGLKDDPEYLQISVEIQPGNSGSPLVNEDGMVVGIVQSTLDPMNVLTRTGGNLPQNVNFALKAAVIDEFLSKNGDNITISAGPLEKLEFDQVSNAVVQVRSGEISEEFLKQHKMVCRVYYESFWDFWYRFRLFHVEFYDLESGDLLLKAGQYGDNALSTETKVIDSTFEQIRAKFNPETIQ